MIYDYRNNLAEIQIILLIPFVIELMFLETSALSGENVEEAFLRCSKNILTRIESGINYIL